VNQVISKYYHSIFVSRLTANNRYQHNTMNTTTIKGLTKVDSARLSIPLSECEIIDTNLIDRIQVLTTNIETGEVINEKGQNGTPTILENSDGTYLKFWKESQFFYHEGKKIPTLYLTFLVNSKHIKELYFNGITLDTLPVLYDYLMSFNVVRFAYDSLLNSRYNDTDICVDFNCTHEGFNALKKAIKSLTKRPELWHAATNQKNNSGIWTPTKNDPRKNATPKSPFVKFYSKHEDFMYKSHDFAKAYINPELYSDLYRIESTIKNADHKKYLGISQAKTFESFLNLDLQLLLQQLVNEYFISDNKLLMKSGELTPMEKVIVDLMNALTEKGATNNELFKYFDRNDISRQARISLKEKYHKLTSLDQFNRDLLESNSSTKDVLSYLGIPFEK
jgi:hypothetical protein